MNNIKFFVRENLFYKDPLKFLGLLYAAKASALKYNPNTRQILIRSDVHRATYDTKTGKMKHDDPHYTIDLKDAAMIQNGTHQTVHGYVSLATQTPSLKSLKAMYIINRVAHKQKGPDDNTARIEKDLWYNADKSVWVNNWDKAITDDLEEIEEPAALREVELGHDLMSEDNKYYPELKVLCDVQRVMKESTKVADRAEDDVRKMWDDRMNEQAEK